MFHHIREALPMNLNNATALWSLNRLSIETGRDRRTLAKILRDVPGDGVVGNHPAWRLATAMGAIATYDAAGTGDMTRDQAKLMRVNFEALLLKLEWETRSAEVVRVEDARQLVATEYQRVRERVMQIPSSVAPIVAQLNNPSE